MANEPPVKPPKPDSCKLCTLYDSKEGIVFGVGPVDADMMAVGEAPGEEEGLTLEPFKGGSGRVLNALFRHAGIDRTKVFLTNVVKCRPTAKNTQGHLVNRTPTEHEIRCCAPLLVQELHRVQPNVVLALGSIPMTTLTGSTKGIMRARSVPTEGSKRNDGLAERYKVVGTFHPAFVMRRQDFWPVTVYDMVRAKSESSSPVISRRPWKRVIHARLADVGEYLERRIREPRLLGLRYYHHDLETTGLNPRRDSIRCIGIAAEPDEVFCFDWTVDVAQFVERLHKDPTLLTVGQNSEGFDIPFQEGKGFEFNGPTYDTMIGFHLLNASLPKDLDFIGACYTDEPHWKDRSMYRSGEDALQGGCCKDVHATARGFEEQIGEMQVKGQLNLYFNHVMPLQPVLRRMHHRGTKKDIRKAAAWHVVLTRKADEYEARLRKGLGDPTFNVNSPKQLMDLLYTRMGLPVQYNDSKDKGFTPTVDADALDALASDPRVPAQLRPILLLVRSIRTFRKWDATYACCEHDENYFVHGHFSSAKAANGRINAFDPNMQNFPVEIRDIIVPDTNDHVLLARDWSQIEWRIAMARSGDKVGLDALAAGRDPHTDAYANAFEVAYESVTKKNRFEAKTYNYGILYGRGEESLAAGRAGHPESAIPIERVHDYFERFWDKYKAYNQFRGVIQNDVSTKHYVETSWGRRRYWYTRQRMPEAYNYPISGDAAHMMYEALVELDEQLPKGAELRLTVHDEVVINSLKEQKVLRQAIECTRDIMEREFRQVRDMSLYPEVVDHYYPTGWKCPSDWHIGENWRITKGETPRDLEIEAELKKVLGVMDVE